MPVWRTSDGLAQHAATSGRRGQEGELTFWDSVCRSRRQPGVRIPRLSCPTGSTTREVTQLCDAF